MSSISCGMSESWGCCHCSSGYYACPRCARTGLSTTVQGWIRGLMFSIAGRLWQTTICNWNVIFCQNNGQKAIIPWLWPQFVCCPKRLAFTNLKSSRMQDNRWNFSTRMSEKTEQRNHIRHIFEMAILKVAFTVNSSLGSTFCFYIILTLTSHRWVQLSDSALPWNGRFKPRLTYLRKPL